MTEEKLLTADEVAELLTYAKAYIYALNREGKIPQAIRINARKIRWRESDIHEYMRANGFQPPAAAEPASEAEEQPDPEPPQAVPADMEHGPAPEPEDALAAVPEQPPPPSQLSTDYEQGPAKWRGQVVRDHDGDGWWYPVIKAWEGRETKEEAEALLTWAVGVLGGMRDDQPIGESQPAAPAAPQPDAIEALADQWGASLAPRRPSVPRPAHSAPPPAEPTAQPDVPHEDEGVDAWVGAGSDTTRPAEDRPEPGNGLARSAADWAGKGAFDDEISGTVKFWREDKGFGFIVPDDGSADVFVHASVLARVGLHSLELGEAVTFRAHITDRGRQAISVKLSR